MKIACSAIFNI